jgi:hypothetical protein
MCSSPPSMSHTYQDVRHYWLGFVLPTANAAMEDLIQFQKQLTSFGCHKCMCVSMTHQDTQIMRVVGADICDGKHLSNFDDVEPLLSRVLSVLLEEDCVGSYDVQTIGDVALIWLNDVMRAMYNLAEKYHAAIPCVSSYVMDCSSHETSLSGRFPHAVRWENSRRAQELERSLTTMRCVTIGNDIENRDSEDMDPSGYTTPRGTSDVSTSCDWSACDGGSQNMLSPACVTPPLVRRKRGSVEERCPDSPWVSKRVRVSCLGQ